MNTPRHPSRRSFIKHAGLLVPVSLALPSLISAQETGGPGSNARVSTRKSSAPELAADLVIIGGGLGGCAAALAAARNGLRVIMTEETDWIGGSSRPRRSRRMRMR